MTSDQRLEVRHSLTAPGAAYELAPVVLPRGSVQWFTKMPQTLRELYAANATDKPFMVYNDETLTFSEAYTRLSAIAALLVRHGVEPGDRVACEEVFGPFMSVHTFSTDEEALAIANSVDYGLGGILPQPAPPPAGLSRRPSSSRT